MSKHALRLLLAAIILGSALAAPARAEEKPAASDKFLLTVILRHDQSKTVDQIKEHLQNTGFWKKFPPQGVEVVSYNIVMGIGHVITLRLPPDRLRAVNLSIEEGAWGAFRSEFYPTYDYKPVFEDLKAQQNP